MASKYDAYWIGKLDAIRELIEEATERGVSRSIDVSDIAEYGERKNWYGDVVVSDEGIIKWQMAHARSLGRVLLENKMISGKLRFVISSSLKLRVKSLTIKKAEADLKQQDRQNKIYTRFEIKKAKEEPQLKLYPISDIFCEIPIDVWNRIVRQEPEWRFMPELFERYGFGKFAVLMTVIGLNDYQLKGKAETAYWPKIAELLKFHKTPELLDELESVLAKFYSRERLAEQKLRRLNRFLSSRLAERLWNANPKEIAENFEGIWYELAETMKQARDAKTIAFAMKCLGIALLMAGEYSFSFEKIPIPVDYRVKEFTRRLSNLIQNEDDVRVFWSRVLEEIRKKANINMIHLDSLIWQIGVLNDSEIVDYFSRLGLREVGERMIRIWNGVDKGGGVRLCVVPCGSRKIWDIFPNAGPTKSRDVYIGSFARTCVEYAEKFYPDSYVILSAKHGFLFPDDIVPENYNVTFKNPETNPIGVEELRKQAEQKGLTKYDEIVVMAGKDYVEIVKRVFAGKRIITPLKGLSSMGPMMSAMKKAVNVGRELQA